MNIRPEQYAALGADSRDQYCQSLAAFYRATIPGTVAALDDRALLERVTSAEGRGRHWGIAESAAMIRFVGLDLVIGEQFDGSPGVQRLFAAPGMSIDMKVHVLADLVQENLARDGREVTGSA